MHEQPTVAAEPPARGVWSGSSYIQLALVALAGALVLGLVLGVVAPRLAVNFQYNRMLIFAAGAAAAALVLRIRCHGRRPDAPGFLRKLGHLVAVTGVSGAGDFALIVDRASARLIGESSLPSAAPHVSLTQLLTSPEDGQ